MNEDTLKGQWTQLEGRIREQWGSLTDDDLDQIHGRVEQLVGRVQERYGFAHDEAKRQVDAWMRDVRIDARASRRGETDAGLSMIRKLDTGKYRLYSRRPDRKTGRRRNLGTFKTRSAAEEHERAVQFFKRHG